MDGQSQRIFIIDAHAGLIARALQSASPYIGIPEDIHYQPSTRDEALRSLLQKSQNGDVAIISAEALGPPSDMEGLELIRQWWIQTAHRDSNAILAPVVLLTYEDISGILRRHPLCTFILSRACKIVQKPFLLAELVCAINEVSGIETKAQEVEKYLRSSARLVTVATHTEHFMRNLLGPFTLLHGAYRAHAVDQNRYAHAWGKLRTKLGERLTSSLGLVELFYLQGVPVPTALAELPSSSPQGGGPPESPDFVKEAANRTIRNDGKLHVLVIDDEAESGWHDVYQEIFGSSAALEVITRVEETRGGRNIYLSPPEREPSSEPSTVSIDTNEADTKRDDAPLADRFPWQNYDLVLLDLRLLTGEPPRWDDRVDDEIIQRGPAAAQNFSGMMILNGIRRVDPAIPVIMMTASKKSYNLDAAKRRGRVWFLSKEEFLSDRAYGRDSDERATAHYHLFRDYVKEALSQNRQNLRKIWKGINSLPRRTKEHKVFVSGMKRSFVLLSADLDSSFEDLVGERAFASEAIVCIGSALEHLGYRTGGLAGIDLKDIAEAFAKSKDLNDSELKTSLQNFAPGRDEKSKFFAYTIHEIRGAAAHGPGATCINFQDSLFCIWLALKSMRVNVELVGYPSISVPHLKGIWMNPMLGNFNRMSLADPLKMVTSLVNRNRDNAMQILFKYMRFILLADKFGLADPVINGLIHSRFLIKNIMVRAEQNAAETTFGRIEGISSRQQEDAAVLLSAKRWSGNIADPSWCRVPL